MFCFLNSVSFSGAGRQPVDTEVPLSCRWSSMPGHLAVGRGVGEAELWAPSALPLEQEQSCLPWPGRLRCALVVDSQDPAGCSR